MQGLYVGIGRLGGWQGNGLKGEPIFNQLKKIILSVFLMLLLYLWHCPELWRTIKSSFPTYTVHVLSVIIHGQHASSVCAEMHGDIAASTKVSCPTAKYPNSLYLQSLTQWIVILLFLMFCCPEQPPVVLILQSQSSKGTLPGHPQLQLPQRDVATWFTDAWSRALKYLHCLQIKLPSANLRLACTERGTKVPLSHFFSYFIPGSQIVPGSN